MNNSTDIFYSKSVANHLHINHHIHNITNTELLDNLSNTIKNISSYDTTTIRASNPNYLICDYINKNFTKNINSNNKFNIKVLFSGEGSDEISGGYLYLKNSPDSSSFNNECLNLVNNLYLFDVLRSDKCISNNNIEARVPFLDLDFIKYYFTIPTILRNPKFLHCEKFLLRYSFSHLNILPFNVLWRTKEAFSDGVSSTSDSWFSIIQNHVSSIISDDELNYYKLLYPHINIFSKEQVYYLKIYLSYFPNHTHLLPFYWLPKWSNTLEPSARALNVYNNDDQKYDD
jgi:asparagine synthase (glutamine-hydrolysing)